jgi:uncharacterized protein (TIGR02246 family)
MKQRLSIVMVVALLGAVHSSFSIAQEPVTAPTDPKPAAQPDPAAADISLIRAGSEAFVAAFNKHDAQAVAAFWTEQGEYVDDTGRTIAGRDAIEKDYAAFFTENPDVKIQIVIDSLRVLSGEVAIEDGRAVVDPPPPGAPGFSKYTAIHAKVDGKWLMASVRDTWIEAQVTPQSVADLDWLIGTWAAEEYGVKYESICRWVANDQFVERNYTTTSVDGTKTSGVQLIGWNPLEGRVQSWSFSPDGGHDFGVWLPIHDGWMAEMRGTTGQGVPTSSVNLLKRLDDNAYVWQSIQRSVGQTQLPDTNEVVIKRQAAATAQAALAKPDPTSNANN